MILLTPCAFSFSTSAVIVWTSSSIAMFGPGEAISGVSLVTAPTMPIFWPPTSSTIDGLIAVADLGLRVRLDVGAERPGT